MRFFKFIIIPFIVVTCFTACNLIGGKTDYTAGFKAGYIKGFSDAKAKYYTEEKEESTTKDPNLTTAPETSNDVSNPAVPEKAVLVLNFIRKYNKAPEDYVGGRHFGNYEHNLPEQDGAGNKIEYQEWDIQPKVEGKNRGAQRLITGSDGRAWYTADHYSTFTEVK